MVGLHDSLDVSIISVEPPGHCMPNYPHRVFVDANIWISWGPRFKRAEASTLEELVEHGIVKVVSTDLTITEVAKRFGNSDVERLEPLSKPDLSQAAKQLLGLELPVMDKDEMRASFFSRHLASVNFQLTQRMRAEIRSIDSVRPSDVLAHYTRGTGLFSAQVKKDQFPDAFIFAAITADVSSDRPLIIWSSDGDFTQACDQGEHLTQVKAMPQLFDALGIAPEGPAMVELLERDTEIFVVPLEDALIHTDVEAEDSDEVLLEILQVLRVSELSVSSLYRISGEDSQYIGFGRCQATVNASFVAPDWDSAVWNSEDKKPIAVDSIEGQAEVELDEFGFSFLAEIRDSVVISIHGLERKGRWALTARLFDGVRAR